MIKYYDDKSGKGDSMKVSIIDNSLCDASFVDEVKPEAVVAYKDALAEFGVAYTEMTTDTFLMLPPAGDMSKVILRMTSARDLLYINSFNFAYVTVPANLTELIPEIKRPVISELSLHGGDSLRVMEMFEKNFELDNVSMIRFVDDFRESPQEMAQLIRAYRDKYFRPVDICPTNKYTNAVNEAIAAVIAKSDSITMRFGDYERFAELQDYTISLATLFGVAPSPQMILALYKCGCLYAMIYGRRARSTLDDLRFSQISPHYVKNADRYVPMSPNERTTHTSFVRPPDNSAQNSDLLYKKLRSMMVDAVTAQELEEVIDEFCTQLYNKSEAKKN